MDKALIDAFRATDYLVSVDEVEWAGIRIDQPLPPVLQALVGARSWGFITAWNPSAETTRTLAENLAAQRDLLAALRAWPEAVIRPAIGIGRTGWHEPSLFVIGPDITMMDSLARHHEQLAYIHGHADGIAHLRLLE
ncbi:MAG TPA: DUF3293 domain-containing protein [Rhodanobacter sp.]|jgi:hypothetical protein|nr:DUF3293 domain-containing protein [Rhodanobacter sp.]